MAVGVQMAIHIINHVHGVTDSLSYEVGRKSHINEHRDVAMSDIVNPYEFNP